jgi:hypothetical protein
LIIKFTIVLFDYYVFISSLFFKEDLQEGQKDLRRGTKRSPRDQWADEDSKKEQPVILFGA